MTIVGLKLKLKTMNKGKRTKGLELAQGKELRIMKTRSLGDKKLKWKFTICIVTHEVRQVHK